MATCREPDPHQRPLAGPAPRRGQGGVPTPSHRENPAPTATDKNSPSASSRRGDPWPLRAAEDAFVALCTGPCPLAIDGRRIPGLPPREVPLTEVRRLLLRTDADYALRHAVWAHVLDRARAGDPAWVIGAVGLAMPGLRAMASRLFTGTDREGLDLEAELLTGFLTALRDLDAATGRIAARLCWSAYHAADRYRRARPERAGILAPLPASVAPPRPWGHPDFVLADLVRRDVLSQYEAELIARTRLEHLLLSELARQWAVPLSTLSRDRSRAEDRILQTLTTDGKVTVPSRSRPGVETRALSTACRGARTSCPAPPHRPGAASTTTLPPHRTVSGTGTPPRRQEPAAA